MMSQAAKSFSVTNLADCAVDLMAIEHGQKEQTGRLSELVGICESCGYHDPENAAKELVRNAAIEYAAIYTPSPYVPVTPKR